jgi:hypothetical protein
MARAAEPRIVKRKPVGRVRFKLHTRMDGKHFVHFYDKTGPYQPPIQIREKDIQYMMEARDS